MPPDEVPRPARAAPLPEALSTRIPGVLVCGVIALAATFLSEHYGGPQLLYALLMGLAFHFLEGNAQVRPGLDFCARTVLRIGVALLGARITLGQVAELGVATAVAVAVALASTILLGVGMARAFGRPREEGLLSGGSVAICGASAALAIASVLPQTRQNERFTLLAVVAVAVLSTLAMVLYPLALNLLGVPAAQAGIFLGATIHDVAQVVAAGMLLGPQAADTATVVKLFRVLLLVPVVFVIALLYRSPAGCGAPKRRVPAIPGFLLAFAALVILASFGLLPAPAAQVAGDASRWMLVMAIAAAGVKTSFEDLMKLGWQPLAMFLAETVFIALGMVVALAFI